MICQTIENYLERNEKKPFSIGPKNYDISRALKVSSFGFLFIGPLGYHWYRIADKLIPGNSMKEVCVKVAAEMITFSPVYIPMFFVYQGNYNEFCNLQYA